MTPPTPSRHTSGHRRSITVYRGLLRLYPRGFRDDWAEETVLLFAELRRRQPSGASATVRLWTDSLADLGRGLVSEWWREAARLPRAWRHVVAHGALAGALLSIATVAGNLGQLWSTPAGRVASWLISAAALIVLALTGRATIAGSGTIGQALRGGLCSGLIAFALTNLTATVVVIACFDRLSHDPLQLAAFTASHEPDFRTYQVHDLLGGWTYGTAAGALLGTLVSGGGAALSRLGHLYRPGRSP